MNIDIEKAAIFGDWHGNLAFAHQQLLTTMEDHNPDIFLHVGDFGLYPDKRFQQYLDALDNDLEYYDREIWFVDGNHEDFSLIKQLPTDDRGLHIVRDHIYHIPRGHSWIWANTRFLGLGGATSVNRHLFTPGVDWFPEEEITDAEFARALAAPQAQVLISHEAPALPPGMSNAYAVWPDDALHDAALNRDIIKRVVEHHDIKHVFHGHHHTRYDTVAGDLTITGLSHDGGNLADNRYILDLYLEPKLYKEDS